MRTAFAFAIVAVAVALPSFADDDARHPFSAVVPSAGIRRVMIDIPAGEVDLRNSHGRTINIMGEVRGNRQSVVDDTDVVITVNGDEAIIERKFGPRAASWTARTIHNNNVHIRVDVPTGVGVDFGTRFGEIRIEGEFGDVNVDLRAGEIHMRTPYAAVRDLNASVRVGEVHADLGDERVNNEGVFPGATHYHNANGGRSHIVLHTTAGEVHVKLTQ